MLTDKVDDDGFELPFQFLPRGREVHGGTAREAGIGAGCWVEEQWIFDATRFDIDLDNTAALLSVKDGFVILPLTNTLQRIVVPFYNTA